MRKPAVMTAGAAAILAAAVCAQAPKPAATPEEAVKRLEAAILELNKDPDKPGSLEPVLAAFAEPIAEAHKTMFALCPRLGEAETKLRQALDKQFPKESAATTRNKLPELSKYEANFREELSAVNKLEVTKKEPISADRVLLSVRADVKVKGSPTPAVREERHLAVLGNDGWKLMPEKLNDPRRLTALKVQVEAFKKAPEVLERVAREVAEDKYRTRAEAQEAAFTAFVGVLSNLHAQLK
jgi:hypothetical protein